MAILNNMWLDAAAKDKTSILDAGLTKSFMDTAKTTPSLTDMIAMRMRWTSSKRCPFHDMYVIRDNDRVFVFVLNAGQEPIVMKDDFGLFPSDALVSQLRLLEAR